MIAASHNGSHSASVKLTLLVGDERLDVAQMTPTAVYLRNAATLPPCDAYLTISIDGDITRHRIRLPDGATPDSPIVRTLRFQ